MRNSQKILLMLTLFFSVNAAITAQTAEGFIKKGVELFEDGKFKEAIEQYELALKIEPKNTTALYEMSYTFISLKKYDDAIKYAEKVIKLKNGSEDLAYTNLGTAYDMLGKPKKAIKAYEEGIKAFPNEYNLHYNLGITLYRQKEFDKAEIAAMSSIKNNPKHANSHNLLANVELEKNKKIKSLLPFYGYLMLKPTGKISVAIREELEKSYVSGVNVKQDGGSGNRTIYINAAMFGNKEEFGSEESTMSLMASIMSIKLDKKIEDSLKISKTPEGIFLRNTETLFGLLSKKERKPTDSFWQTTYVNPIKELYDAKHVEAFCYSIYGNTEEVKKWQEENVEKVVAYGNWLKEHKEKEVKKGN
jgi:tetratricopeptide (TPR) repeat protein